ncbi:hypothetical protein WJX73_002765 [Symbiochloris irregularis]|uniref:lipoyl(octanoyl) transferase n=1 Tax=Symbiochloris irregularis TaxID=706552 RepID=A0AAW1P6R5_9CHLO
MQKVAGRLIRVCKFRELVDYSSGLVLQTQLAQRVSQGEPDALLLLQHRSVYTIGKRGSLKDFKSSQEDVRKLGADVVSVARGGEVTFHGPGQLVLYPIVNLKRLKLGARAYVESLEDTVVQLAAAYGIHAEGRQKGRTGVWTEDRKLAAIGLQFQKHMFCKPEELL